jgi:hypothetical protein
VLTQDLGQYIRSKRDLYDILRYSGQFVIPPFDEVSMDFLKAVLAGQKKLLQCNQAKQFQVPRFKEFQTDALYQKALTDTVVSQYLPDPIGEERRRTVGRNYLFTVSDPCRGHQAS